MDLSASTSFNQDPNLPSYMDTAAAVNTSGTGPTDSCDMDTTLSSVKEANIRERTTSKWICNFQIMEPLEVLSQQHVAGSVDITEEADVARVDERLRTFFLIFNKKAKEITSKNTKVNRVLAARYIYHASDKFTAGIIVVETDIQKNNAQFNCHLLLEKFRPNNPVVFEGSHKVYIGHAYPIHTQDISCTGGNSLRSLLKLWVDEKFYNSLHWIIKPSTKPLSRDDANRMENAERQNFIHLIKEMKDAVLECPRRNLNPNTSGSRRQNNSSIRRNESPNANTSIIEYLNITEGERYSLMSHQWSIYPLNTDGSINETVYRAYKSIIRRGGLVDMADNL